MSDDLNQHAIQAALDGKWNEAVEFNRALLRNDEENIQTLNRLARAYLELNNIGDAAAIYRKVLKLDKYNPIAKKNLQRIKTKSKNSKNIHIVASKPPINTNFLEEPGKTKTTQLVRLADADVIANLAIGEPLFLEAHKRSVCVKNESGTHIGALPDDLSLRLGKLLQLDYKYHTFIKSVSGHTVQIFIRELKRGSKYKNVPSFPNTSSSGYHSDIRHALLEEEPIDTRETGEE